MNTIKNALTFFLHLCLKVDNILSWYKNKIYEKNKRNIKN